MVKYKGIVTRKLFGWLKKKPQTPKNFSAQGFTPDLTLLQIADGFIVPPEAVYEVTYAIAAMGGVPPEFWQERPRNPVFQGIPVNGGYAPALPELRLVESRSIYGFERGDESSGSQRPPQGETGLRDTDR